MPPVLKSWIERNPTTIHIAISVLTGLFMTASLIWNTSAERQNVRENQRVFQAQMSWQMESDRERMARTERNMEDLRLTMKEIADKLNRHLETTVR